MREEEGLGGAGTALGRALRISRSSKSDIASEMSPSEGSESDTSSMRACDMVEVRVVVVVVVVVVDLEMLWRGCIFGGVNFGFEMKLGSISLGRPST